MIKKKGFTLVELLAVVAILGILMAVAIPAVGNLVKNSKEEHDKNIVETVLMATKSYVQDNKKEAPKYIGAKELIHIKTLRDSNYLKEDIKNSNKESCMKESYVAVFKKDIRNYEYTPYLRCGDETYSDESVISPGINIFLSDSAGKEVASTKAEENMAISNIRIVMFGQEQKNNKVCNESVDGLGLVGYSIFVYKYKNDENGGINEKEYAEIYNSGSQQANGKKCLTIGIDLAEYIDVTQRNKLKIVVRANNEKGGEKIFAFDQVFDDSEDKLECGNIHWAPADDEWSNKRERTVGVECIDHGGSGCQKPTFVKTFTSQMKKGTITIKDNRGNEKECKVNVNLDWTRPKVTIKAYKIKKNSKKGSAAIDEVVTTKAETEIKTYKKGYGDDSWLNKANYPYGIHYNITINDNLTLKEGNWKINEASLKKNDAGVTTLPDKSLAVKINGKKGSLSFDITKDGYRYGKFVIKDKAGNKTVVKITAPLDRKVPSATINLYQKKNQTNLNAKSKVTNLSEYVNNTWSKNWVFTKVTSLKDNISGVASYGSTLTYKKKNETKTRTETKDKKFRNINAEGINKIYYKFVDNAGNVKKTITYNIKLDRTEPTCTTSKTAEGENGVNVSIDCQKNDEFSNITCPKNEVGLKESKDYVVKDEAGNPGKCSVSISSKKQYLLKSCTGHSECKKTDECISSGGYSGTCLCYDDNTGNGLDLNDDGGYSCNAPSCTESCRNHMGGQKYYSGKGTCNCLKYKYVSSESCTCLNWATDGYWSDSGCPANSSTTCNDTGSTRLYYY